MASRREYTYQIKGNKLSLLEKDYSTSSGLGLAGVSTDGTQYGTSGDGITDDIPSGTTVVKSPLLSVTDGIEIEYAYSPIYRLNSTGTEGSDFHRFLGWGSDGTNLLLFTFSGASSVVNLSSLFAVNDYIVISGSGRWNGLHQVKSTGGSTGILTLKTKCNLKPSAITVTGTFEADDETFIGDTGAHIIDIETFKDIINSKRETPYIFIDNAANGANHGLFSLSDNSTSGKITLNNKISIDTDGDYTETAAIAVDGGNDTVTIYNAFYEQITVEEGVEVLADESSEIDVSPYLAKALVYYVKAKLAEDQMNIEVKEYMMREFRRMLEKHESSKVSGPRMIMPGPNALR